MKAKSNMSVKSLGVLVIGASRGIGLELVRQYREHDDATVTATARNHAGLVRLQDLDAETIKLDVTSEASTGGLGARLEDRRFDVVIVNAGVYGPRSTGLEPPNEEDFDTVMHTNVLGPMRLIPQVVRALRPGARLAVISSRMASMGLRTSHAGWLYRASKAALNSVLKDASLTLANQATCVALHPGWVRTDMGGSGADISVEASATGLRAVIANLSPNDNGAFFDHQGQRLAW